MIIVTPDTPLRDLLACAEEVLDVLARYDLDCAACVGATFGTVRDACIAHDIDVKSLTDDLTAALAESK